MSEDRYLLVPNDDLADETPVHSRRSLMRTAFMGLSVVGLGATLSGCSWTDDDDDDVNDAVNTVESEGDDAVDDIEDGAGNAGDDIDDEIDEVETEVDS